MNKMLQMVFLAVVIGVLLSGASSAQQTQVAPTTPSAPAPTRLQPSGGVVPQMQAPSAAPQQAPSSPAVIQQPSPLQPVQPQVQPSVTPPVPQLQPETLSEFEQYVSGKAPSEISMDLRQFGYDLFKKPEAFVPEEKVPVGPEYVIGPGDEIRISVWGKVEGQWSVTVDRDGKINLPKAGLIGVAGLTFKEMKELIHKEISKYYTGFEISVSMGALRTIRVYVVGMASTPGAYTVSSLSTLVNALFTSGGPDKKGSMRDIQVKRNSKTIVHFDLYDLLLKGDKTMDVRLMPEDVIFIPPVRQLIAIAGNVKSPAIYEMKGETRLLDLIQMAGGLNSIAFKGRVQVSRTEDHQYRVAFEGDLVDIGKQREKNILMQDGDIVKVYAVADKINIVNITGAVEKPGEYAINDGESRLKDLIEKAGGLRYYASTQAEMTRVKVTQTGPLTERMVIDLTKTMQNDPQHNIIMEKNDSLFVRAVPEWDLYKTVVIAGEVKYPGTYTIRKGERLSSVVERAGGFTEWAYLRGAMFTRESVRELQQRQIDEMIDRLEREVTSTTLSSTMTATTAEEAKFSSIESQAKMAFIQKLRTVRAKGRVSLRIDQPEELKKSVFDIQLEEGDMIHIPSDTQSVQVIGSVNNQTAFVFFSGKRYSDYVNLAGGYTASADKSRVYILKVDGTASLPGQGGGLSWNKSEKRWDFGGGNKDIESGDTIVVPEKIERIAWLRNIKDITQILFQIAVGAGVIIAAF